MKSAEVSLLTNNTLESSLLSSEPVWWKDRWELPLVRVQSPWMNPLEMPPTQVVEAVDDCMAVLLEIKVAIQLGKTYFPT